MYSNNTNSGGGPTTLSLPSDYNRSGVGEPTCKRPLKKNAVQSFQPTVAVLTFAVLLCVFSCSLTVALSYKWYADADRQINVLLAVVEDVTCDMHKLTDIIRDELVAKRLPNNGGGSSSTAKTSSADYDDTDDDYPVDRFMGRDLSDNNWPTKTFRGPTQAAAGSGDEEFGQASEDRRRRSAEVDAKSAAVKNQPNGSNYDKTNVELLDDANEENTVKTYRRRPKKMQSKKKPAEDSSVSYELKEAPQNVVAAHFYSDKSKYNTITHPHYDGNGRLRHPDGEFKDWTHNIWDADTNSANYFQMNNGHVTVSKPGIYFVYAQINYSDQHDINGYYILKNNEKVFGCTTQRYQANQSDSCYTGGLIHLNSKDVISIKGFYSERYIFLDPLSSFFGLFLVSSKDGKR